jgi:hypothetical protein
MLKALARLGKIPVIGTFLARLALYLSAQVPGVERRGLWAFFYSPPFLSTETGQSES